MMPTEAEHRATQWLRAWDGSGIHRTGTAGDHAGAAWLAEEAKSLGANVSVEEFTLDRLDPMTAHLEVDDTRIDGVPVFDAPVSGADGITGALGPAGSAAAIGVVELSPLAVYSGEYRAVRRSASHAALVIVCQGDQPGLALLNAEQFREPFGCPALHVSGEARERVLAAAAHGAAGRLVAQSKRTTARAANIVVSLIGRERTRRPLVVMTPRSSWWQSTAERGGGLVCWLETLRTVLRAEPASDVVFTANSGHELGHLGLDEFVARRPGWDHANGAIWLHYGANIGAVGGILSLQSADDPLRAAGAHALSGAGVAPVVLVPKTRVPSGETRDIHRAGGRYLTLVGSNPWFHLPQDRWPHSVDVATTARIAAGMAALVARLTR
jgi:hypothetical protein